MDSLNIIRDNYFSLDQEYQFSSKEKDKEIERLNNIINELKLCNNDYYNKVNICTSKLSRIRERLDYYVTNAESLSEDILAIINEKY